MSNIDNITVNKNECTPYPETYLEQNEEKILSFEPHIQNFYDTVDVYGDADISNEELEYVKQALMDAAQYVSVVESDLFVLSPLFSRLNVVYRPQCFSLTPSLIEDGGMESVQGRSVGDTIILSPMNLFENSECTYETRSVLGPSEIVSLASDAAHEMIHTYFFPRFHADPANIIAEGITTLVQFMYGSDYGGFSYLPGILVDSKKTNAEYVTGQLSLLHQRFPVMPAVPLSSYAFESELNVQITDDNGHVIDVAVVRDDILGFRLMINGGEKGIIAAGEYILLDELGYIIAIGEHDGGYDLHVLDPHNEIRRVGAISGGENANLGGSVEFGEYGMIWAADGFGGTDIFMRAPGESFSIDFDFDQQGIKVGDMFNYYASFIMHTELERLYWRTHSDEAGFHPEDYYRKLGDLHKKYRAYLFNDPSVSENKGKYYTGETNVYHELCNEMSLPTDECLAVFKKFGLDVEYFDPATGGNFCLPDNDEELEKWYTITYSGDEVEVSGADHSDDSASGCSASPASSDFGRSIDIAISHTLGEAVEEFGYLLRQLF